MKEKHRIEGDNFMVSTDGGKTWKVERVATQAEKDSYAAHKAKKKDEKPKLTEEQKKPGMMPSMQRVDKKVITSGPKADTPTNTGEPALEHATVWEEGKAKVPYGMSEAYGPKGVRNLNEHRKHYGLPPISEKSTKDQIKAAAGELQQKAIEVNPELVDHYMRERNPKPNAKLEEALKKKGYGITNADLRKAVADKAISADEIRSAYKDDQWWFRALDTRKKRISREEYDKKMKEPGAIKQGDKTFFGDDSENPHLYTEYEPYDPKKPEAKVEVKSGPGVINPARQPFTKRGYIPPKPATYAPWWMQDIVKTTGAANDLMRVKQYMPWQAEPEVYLPDATFYDPTRELAANAEQANIQTQGLAAFTGPQALSARSSAIQGQGAKNAADIMARYNNLNVGIANQLSGQRSDIMNTAAQNQANMDTQLWDKYTIANQQFDNAKNQARQHLRQSYIDAITNRAKTQALNTLYPNYYTDPSRGGFVNFKGDPNKIRANRPDFTNEYRDAFELTGSHAGTMDYLRYKKGMPATKGAYDGYGVGYDESANYLKNQKYPGPGASYNTTTEAK